MKANRKTIIAVVALAGAALGWGPLAYANSVGIWMNESVNGTWLYTGTLAPYAQLVATGTNSAGYTSDYGNFVANLIGGASLTGASTMLSSNVNVSFAMNGYDGYSGLPNVQPGDLIALDVWIAGYGITQPTGNLSLASSYTTNHLAGGWQLTEYAYYGNGAGTTAVDTLGHALFTGPLNNATDTSLTTQLGVAPYSIIHLYEFTLIAGSNMDGTNSNDTVTTRSLPEPGSLGMLGLGLSAIGALGWIRRRNRKKAG